MDMKTQLVVLIGAMVLLIANLHAESAECPNKGAITCGKGQVAIDENDLVIHRMTSNRRFGGGRKKIYMNPAETTNLMSNDRIYLTFRPGGEEATMKDVQCFKADIEGARIIKYTFTNETSVCMFMWKNRDMSWVNSMGIDDEKLFGFDQIRVELMKGSEKKIRNFDFVGCVDTPKIVSLKPTKSHNRQLDRF